MKYKSKGFTLIEILAVVTIIGLIFILVIPKITTSLKNKKSDVDKTTENLVLRRLNYMYLSIHLNLKKQMVIYHACHYIN